MEFSKMYVDSVFSKALSVRPIFAHSALTHSDVDAAMIVERDWVFRLQSSTLVDGGRHFAPRDGHRILANAHVTPWLLLFIVRKFGVCVCVRQLYTRCWKSIEMLAVWVTVWIAAATHIYTNQCVFQVLFNSGLNDK